MTKKIPVTKGTGTGNTQLSAFDAALFDAGIANYNLIHLSSIVPEGFEPVVEKVNLNGGAEQFGYRLYVVIAEHRQGERGKQTWAGLGWVMTKSETKKGLFVEHIGESKEEVVDQSKPVGYDQIPKGGLGRDTVGSGWPQM